MENSRYETSQAAFENLTRSDDRIVHRIPPVLKSTSIGVPFCAIGFYSACKEDGVRELAVRIFRLRGF